MARQTAQRPARIGVGTGVVEGRRRRFGLAMVVAMAGLPASAVAQLAPPPGPAPAPTPVVETPIVTPRPAQRTPAADERQRTAEEAAREALARQNTNVLISNLPDLPYESLVRRDSVGRVIPLKRSQHMAALESNPLLDDSSVERFQGVIAERRARMERAVIDNVDLVEQIRGGVIERADVGSPETLRAMLAVVGPFQQLGHLTDDLRAQRYFSDDQFAWNWKIVLEYEEAMRRDIMERAAADTSPDAPNPLSLVTRYVMGDYLREPMEAYEGLLLEGVGRLDEVMRGIEVSAEQRGAVSASAAAVRGAGDDAARLNAAHGLMDALTVDQRRRWLENVIETR